MPGSNTKNTNTKVQKISKKLSWLLRHGAPSAGIAMDAAGWVSVSDVLKTLSISLFELDLAVRENNKSRLERSGDRIRACQGHSRENMPVTLEALEASWAEYAGAGPIWHGTHAAAITGIAREGILAGERTHVHLAAELDSRVGKRANVDVMLSISPQGLRESGFFVFESSNGVLLCRHVPVSCLIGLEAISAAAKRDKNRLCALLFEGRK